MGFLFLVILFLSTGSNLGGLSCMNTYSNLASLVTSPLPRDYFGLPFDRKGPLVLIPLLNLNYLARAYI